MSDDETLFAWGLVPADNWVEAATRARLLALSVRDFELPEGVNMIRHHGLSEVHGFRADHYLVTNKGVRFRKRVQTASRGAVPLHLIPLMCSLSETSAGPSPRGSSMLALLMESDRTDPNKYYRVCEQPISVPREIFRSSRATTKELYVSDHREGCSVIDVRILRIIRPATLKKADVDRGIRLSFFYPPGMQVINRFGENTLLVHRYERAGSRQYGRGLWAGWEDTLWPGMRSCAYFISFNGTLGSFVVMIFPGVHGEDRLPFKQDEQRANSEGTPTQQKVKYVVPHTSNGPVTRTWQFRVARLTPPRTSLMEKFVRLTSGKTPQPSARLSNILQASVDVRTLPWAEELPCKPLGTLRFKVTGKRSEAWTLAMEFDMAEKSAGTNPLLDAILANPFIRYKASRFRKKVAEMADDSESVIDAGTTNDSSTDSDEDSMRRGISR